MTSRERVLTALDLGVADRVPLDIWATSEVWAKLQQHFATDDNLLIRERLHIDGFAGCAPEYIGPPIPEYADGTIENFWGMRSVAKEYGTGTYMEQFYYPLAFAETVADLDEYRWPSPDWFDFSTIRRQCEEHDERAIMAGYVAPFYYFNLLRGLEQSLVDMVANPELSHAIIARICEFFYGFSERLFEAAEGLIDVTQLTDDFGTQTDLMISEQMFDEFFLGQYKRFADLMRRHGIRVFHHDDGAMWKLIPRMIDLGVNVLNPIQYKCGNLDLAWLKDTYGDRLAFHGGVDNQEVLPFGNVEDVIAETRKCLETLGTGGGYVLAPCHNIQAVTPVENIIAMYETAYHEGRY
jgi:uroporphyrinogen decarboxylase